MRAIDTNIVVRLFTRDDPQQALAAKALIESDDIYVSVTVLLEVEWVLRSYYAFDARHVIAALRSLFGLANIVLEDAPAIARTLELAETGLDFADALHLSRTPEAEDFVTFDKRLARKAGTAGPVRVSLLQSQ